MLLRILTIMSFKMIIFPIFCHIFLLLSMLTFNDLDQNIFWICLLVVKTKPVIWSYQIMYTSNFVFPDFWTLISLKRLEIGPQKGGGQFRFSYYGQSIECYMNPEFGHFFPRSTPKVHVGSSGNFPFICFNCHQLRCYNCICGRSEGTYGCLLPLANCYRPIRLFNN